MQKLQAMSRRLPEFRYVTTAVQYHHGCCNQASNYRGRKAPFIAEDLLNFIQKEAVDTQSLELRPNAVIYNNVMQAWAVSGLPQAPDKMDELLETMRKEGIVPDEVTYNILLRYWANRGAVDEIEAILKTERRRKDWLLVGRALSTGSLLLCKSGKH